jgi:hypothetical protein
MEHESCVGNQIRPRRNRSGVNNNHAALPRRTRHWAITQAHALG